MNIYAEITITDWFSGYSRREWTDLYQLSNIDGVFYWSLLPYTKNRNQFIINAILTKKCKEIDRLKNRGTFFLFKEGDLD